VGGAKSDETRGRGERKFAVFEVTGVVPTKRKKRHGAAPAMGPQLWGATVWRNSFWASGENGEIKNHVKKNRNKVILTQT